MPCISNIGAQGNNESVLSYYIFYASHSIVMMKMTSNRRCWCATSGCPSQVDINLSQLPGPGDAHDIAFLTVRCSLGILLGTKLSGLSFTTDVFFQNFQNITTVLMKLICGLSFRTIQKQTPGMKRFKNFFPARNRCPLTIGFGIWRENLSPQLCSFQGGQHKIFMVLRFFILRIFKSLFATIRL